MVSFSGGTTVDKLPTDTQWLTFDLVLAVLKVDPVLLNTDGSAVVTLSPGS